MNEHGLTKENLVATLPVALQKDESAVALAEAIAELLSKRPAEIDRLRIYPAIDQLDEQLLDILAYDFKADWWDADYSVEEKRRTLKSSWRVHKMLGTKAAVETAISAIYPGTKVQEWFEYGGEPYHFRLHISAAGLQSDAEKHKRVLERVNYYKSLRSHLDGFVWDLTKEPFVNGPGHLIFRHFKIAWTFSHLRGYRFNGALDFGRDDVLFNQSSIGLGFPRFQIAPLRFSHFNSAVRFDGNADFDGGVDFEQAYGFMGLPSFHMNSGFYGQKDRLCTPFFGSAAKFNNRGEFGFQQLSAAAAFKHSEGLSGKITMDNWRTFDSKIHFDGTRTFNAYIKEEEL